MNFEIIEFPNQCHLPVNTVEDLLKEDWETVDKAGSDELVASYKLYYVSY